MQTARAIRVAICEFDTAKQESESLWISGDHALKEWARYGHDRGPDWSSSCTLYRAFYGGGGRDPPMPNHIVEIDRIVARLTPIIKAVVRCYYVHRSLPWREHAKQLQLSRRDFQAKLRVGQTNVARML